jgi:hypothetical protein
MTKHPILSGLICAAMAAVPLAAASVNNNREATSQPSVYYTPINQGEINSLLLSLQTDSQSAQHHASMLKFSEVEFGWQPQATLLNQVRTEVNDMGAKLSRLQDLRAELSPAQKQNIDQLSNTIQLMAISAKDAIAVGNANRQDLWNTTYQRDVSNIYYDAKALTSSVGDAVHYAKTAGQENSEAGF